MYLFLEMDYIRPTDAVMVGMRGLEPPSLAAHAPKACVSTISPHPQLLALIYYMDDDLLEASTRHNSIK